MTVTHQVKKTDTLQGIALAYGCSCELNVSFPR